MTENTDQHLAAIEKEMEWLGAVISIRIDALKKKQPGEKFANLLPPAPEPSHYTDFVVQYGLSAAERLVLALTLAPHFAPELLDLFFCRNPETNQLYTEFGGIKGKTHLGFLPTVQTALFLLGGTVVSERLMFRNLFSEDHLFRKNNILHTAEPGDEEPIQSAALFITPELPERFLSGKILPPVFGNDFPAKRITSEMNWDDLILSAATKRQVEEVKTWMRQYDRLMNELGMKKQLKPGNKILFHGPPGTGKTLTASLLGKYIGKEVYRIDLSMIVSKYIGETEKNLSRVFDKAQFSDWILFFDEADALFGSRTKVNSSHDRYANQEVSYLLQRIEDYPGIVILATNMKGNIDDAFMRRFNGVVSFPFPKAEERAQLWKNAFSEKIGFAGSVDIRKVAEKYEIAGGSIVNVAAWCQLMALEKNDYMVDESMLRKGVARELAKEGRTL